MGSAARMKNIGRRRQGLCLFASLAWGAALPLADAGLVTNRPPQSQLGAGRRRPDRRPDDRPRRFSARCAAARLELEKERRMLHLVNTLPDLAWLKDGSGVLACNREFERYFRADQPTSSAAPTTTWFPGNRPISTAAGFRGGDPGDDERLRRKGKLCRRRPHRPARNHQVADVRRRRQSSASSASAATSPSAGARPAPWRPPGAAPWPRWSRCPTSPSSGSCRRPGVLLEPGLPAPLRLERTGSPGPADRRTVPAADGEGGFAAAGAKNSPNTGGRGGRSNIAPRHRAGAERYLMSSLFSIPGQRLPGAGRHGGRHHRPQARRKRRPGHRGALPIALHASPVAASVARVADGRFADVNERYLTDFGWAGTRSSAHLGRDRPVADRAIPRRLGLPAPRRRHPDRLRDALERPPRRLALGTHLGQGDRPRRRAPYPSASPSTSPSARRRKRRCGANESRYRSLYDSMLSTVTPGGPGRLHRREQRRLPQDAGLFHGGTGAADLS